MHQRKSLPAETVATALTDKALWTKWRDAVDGDEKVVQADCECALSAVLLKLARCKLQDVNGLLRLRADPKHQLLDQQTTRGDARKNMDSTTRTRTKKEPGENDDGDEDEEEEDEDEDGGDEGQAGGGHGEAGHGHGSGGVEPGEAVKCVARKRAAVGEPEGAAKPALKRRKVEEKKERIVKDARAAKAQEKELAKAAKAKAEAEAKMMKMEERKQKKQEKQEMSRAEKQAPPVEGRKRPAKANLAEQDAKRVCGAGRVTRRG